ncbi:MAG: VOC family protein [Alphaproteobacteria bacterium]|nr:VOC family protein [Alphaproteobacteria bacterium]
MSELVPAGILETVLYAEDLEAAEAFYSGVLGFEVFSKRAGRQVFFRCGEQMLLIFNPVATAVPPQSDASLPVPPHGAQGAGHVCFKASGEQITAWKDHLEGRGVMIEADFEWPQGGRSIYFRDSAGNSLEFAEPRIWGME